MNVFLISWQEPVNISSLDLKPMFKVKEFNDGGLQKYLDVITANYLLSKYKYELKLKVQYLYQKKDFNDDDW